MMDFNPFPVGAVLVMGPPGSGKGTQANLIASRLKFFHFDTGAYLERALFDPSRDGDVETEKEKENFKSGKMISPPFVLNILKEGVIKIAHAGIGIVFSGSPRTLFEAFGDDKTEGLMEILEKIYGRERIIALEMNVPPATSIYRNSLRKICESCGAIMLPKEIIGTSLSSCPLCGGKLAQRALDTEEIIKKRLAVFENETAPVISALRQKGIHVHKVDATPLPYAIFESILKKLYDFFSQPKRT